MTIWLYVALGVYAALCIIPVAFVGGLVSMIEYDFPSGGHLSLLLGISHASQTSRLTRRSDSCFTEGRRPPRP